MIYIVIYAKVMFLDDTPAFLERLIIQLKQRIAKLVNEAGGQDLKGPAIPHFRENLKSEEQIVI